MEEKKMEESQIGLECAPVVFLHGRVGVFVDDVVVGLDGMKAHKRSRVSRDVHLSATEHHSTGKIAYPEGW